MCSEVTSTTTSGEMLADGDNRAECQRYLVSFRVHELKELLRSIGCSQRGRKNDLFQRSNELLQHGSPKIQNKIREIYERSHYTKRSPFSHRTYRYSPTKPAPSQTHSYIVHPDVTYKPHPFFQKVDSIIRPTALYCPQLGGHIMQPPSWGESESEPKSLVSTAMASNGSLSMKLKFHLTPQQVQEVYRSKTAQGTYQTQILLRFCRQETSCPQEDYYPKQCYVRVNSHHCPIPGYHPQLSTRPDYKRNGNPVNITNYVKTSAAQANEVVIFWAHDILYPMGFCVCVDMVHGLSASELLLGLKSKGVRSPDVSRALVREKLMVDRDSEISATSLRVSLLCPLGKMRMTHPCRSALCTHLQCFDASVYLQMNEKKARWVCPVCDKQAPLADLVIDGLFMEICEKSSSNDIEFATDGSWHAISEKDIQATNLSTPPDRRLGSTPLTIRDTPERRVGSSHSPVVIDLTLSSDEEEEEPSERRHRRISSSSTISAASNDLSRDYSSDTQDEELQREDLSTRTLISQGAQPVSVITQGRLPPPLPSYRLLHNDLPSSVSTMVDESLFTSLLDENIFSLFNTGFTSSRSISPSDPSVISLD